MKTKKLKKTIFKDALIALAIFLCSFLVYIHDFEIFKGLPGFSGFSSLRVGLFVVSILVLALVPWIGWYISSKGKRYSFVMLVPIFMIIYQLGVYLLDARDHTTNEFNYKVILQFSFIFLLIALYFFGKIKKLK